MTTIDVSETEDKIVLLACPIAKNSNYASFHIYNLKHTPTKEVEKLEFTDNEHPEITFTFFNTRDEKETYKAHSDPLKKYSGTDLKKDCRVEWGEEDGTSKQITCVSPNKETYTDWIKEVVAKPT